jgi:hypothetical protein
LKAARQSFKEQFRLYTGVVPEAEMAAVVGKTVKTLLETS